MLKLYTANVLNLEQYLPAKKAKTNSADTDQTASEANVLKFRTIFACQIGIDKQSSLIRVFHVCYSDKQIMNISKNQDFR